jgi:RND family efflux transporter MFP subunit
MVAVEVVVASVVMRGRRIPWRRPAVSPLALCMAAALGCGSGNRYAPPPPPEVTVQRPVEREVTIYAEFSGHTVAYASADIRARVQGYLQSYDFTPGSDVKKGDLLFVIEPALYQAQLDQAKADLAGKEAQYRAAEQQLEITQAIYQRSAGSRADLVNKTQARDLAKAEVDNARALLEAAALNLSYTHIYAPFDGLIDRNLVDIGNLVGSGTPTLLATIVRYDPIYAYFTLSERELLEYRQWLHSGSDSAKDPSDVAYLSLASEKGFPHLGRVDYTSNRVDPDTGTIELRAVFPNPQRLILPGLFVRVRLPMSHGPALLIPEVALSADLEGQYLLVVNDKNVVEYRRVVVGPVIGGALRVVREGIGPNDWVIVNGLQRARPGSEVKPTHGEAPAPAPTDAKGGP